MKREASCVRGKERLGAARLGLCSNSNRTARGGGRSRRRRRRRRRWRRRRWCQCQCAAFCFGFLFTTSISAARAPIQRCSQAAAVLHGRRSPSWTRSCSHSRKLELR
ncbi:hypothetical protein GN956_G25272 [Arapaima gigas]